MRFVERGDVLVVSTRFSELLDRAARDRLSSGFATTVSVRAYAVPIGDEVPITAARATFRVVYDLWGEDYVVRVETAAGKQNHRLERRAAVVREITRLDRFPIGRLDAFEVGPRYVLWLVVELNPVPDELLAEIRRWLTRPAADARLDTASSFFGSFVSVFVNPRLAKADRVLRIHSQPFYRTKR
jgi:hypothetical protein